MICIDYPCDKCKNKLPKVDGWIPACTAFPEGIPDEILFYADVTKLPECNNGIKFELEEQE